ncbi:MAG TPA: hypothetical protein VFD92_26015 [Candidatus Binatia bacterium]|nr:hypothetical protein [Candidatus Binatia bacterium]
MNVTIELSLDELRLLVSHLGRHIDHLDHELVRTDNPELQHAFAREVEAIRSIASRLDAASVAG